MRTYRIYGNSDASPEGFPSEKSIRDYIRGGIFRENNGRYRYSQKTFAHTIVLSYEGVAHGHFDIIDAVPPTAEDVAAFSKTVCVFRVSRSTIYPKPVKLYDSSTPEEGPDSFRYRVVQAGLEITEKDFEKIVAKAGKPETFPAEISDRRYCRICYNSNGWRRPTGTADETTGSYYADHGFGHEEWLFNYEWCINGYKYGFLQPFNGVTGHRGQWFSLKLFTNLGGRSFLAGTISRVYVPREDELQMVYDHMNAHGWIDQMRQDVRALPGGDVDELNTTKPELFTNVRFQREDVNIFDRMPEYPNGSKPRDANRYKLMHDEDGDWIPTLAEAIDPDDPNELQTIRTAQQGTIIDLAHRRLQLKLYRSLCKQHGKQAVRMEFECVDLRVTLPKGTTFYEIKTETSAKKCIRAALGQLFEYSTYVDTAKADTWVVVGDPAPTPHDVRYLAHLRNTFGIPLYYAQFDWEMETLTSIS